MIRRALSTFLALLMLTPGGVCACDGGVPRCPDHPSTVSPTAPSVGAGCCRSCPVEVVSSEPGPALDHRCPQPLPHQPTCPTVAAAAPADFSAPDDGAASAATTADGPAAYGTVERCRTGRVPVPRRGDAAPLFLTHCALLI